MIIHIYNLIILFFLSLFKKNNNKNLIILFLSIISILDGIRYNCYYDYESYMRHFLKLENWKLEKGYEIFVDFFRLLHSYNFMLFIISILVYYFVFYKNYKFLNYNSFFIYLAFSQIIPYIGVNRQLLSLVFLSVGIQFLLKENIKYFLLYSFLGSTFHITALIIIPIGIFFYYLQSCILKNILKIIVLFIIITHVFIFFDVNIIINFILNSHNFFTRYHHYLLDVEKNSLGIFQYMIRNFEILFPIVFIIKEKNNFYNDTSINKMTFILSLIGVLLYYFIYFTFYGKFQILVGRLALTLRGLFIPMYYTSTYNLLKNKKNKEILLIVSLIIFGILFFKTIYGEQVHQYVYKTIFELY